MRIKLTLAVVLFVYLIVANAQVNINVTGTWQMTVESSVGSGNPTFVLKHINDTKLEGTYTGRLGESDVKGSLKGNKIYLEFEVSGNTIIYEGTITEETMKGTVTLGSMGEGTFTGKRIKKG